jgi:hypothetical protein
MPQVTHIARRKIEAEMIGRIYREMCSVMDPSAALEILTRTIEKAATEEGRRFAAGAEGTPGLAHFKTVLADWDEALEVQMVEDTDDVLRFDVARCDYIKAYEDLGLPSALVGLLSCRRDAAFARGYSEHIEFTRSGTLAEGRDRCDFCYRWVGG